MKTLRPTLEGNKSRGAEKGRRDPGKTDGDSSLKSLQKSKQNSRKRGDECRAAKVLVKEGGADIERRGSTQKKERNWSWKGGGSCLHQNGARG